MWIHNRRLPEWVHRLCNGVLGAAASATLASVGLSTSAPASLLHRLSVVLLCLSLPIGLFLAVFTRRCSVVEGIAGRDGYVKLDRTPRPRQGPNVPSHVQGQVGRP